MRTQIQLSRDQYRRVKRWAKDLGISISEAVRRCISEHLAREETRPRREELVAAALAVCGKYADSKTPSHVARDHDRHLAEAYRK